ncbi:MAG: hypothetical protein GXP49_07320, partial [Deltaproteobacteria bacterium]|nr:hypothetical protein [Deltaproteobacteria bacterium]
ERRCKLLDGSSFADLDPKIPDDLSELSKAFGKTPDSESRLTIALHIACHDPGAGAKRLLDVLKTAQVPFVRNEALSAISKLAGRKFPKVDPDRDASANAPGLQSIEKWIQNTWAGKQEK